MRTLNVLSVAVLFLAALASCGRDRKPAEGGKAKVLATVNGVPITEVDVDQRARGAPRGGGPDHDAAGMGNVLQTVVREELVSQRAVELGLDSDPSYSQRLAALEAQVRAFKRQELGAVYRRWVQEKAAPTEADARAWFEKNAAFVQTRFHVLQILRRGGSAEIAQDLADVRSGTPFETVAARRFPATPAGGVAPWDLGEMHWTQVPPAWRGVLERMEPGQVSDVIKGEGERYWVIKLAGKRVDQAITFETEKERISQSLRQQKFVETYDAMLAELKAKADVVYAK